MRYFIRREKAVLGRRGRVILHFCLIWLVLGAATVLTPSKPDAIALEHNHGHTLLLVVLLPVWLQAMLWTVSALVAACFARTDPARAQDRIAFQALIIPPSIYTFSYLSAFVLNAAITHYTVWVYLAGVFLWGCMISLILSFASWAEPRSTVGDIR